jgi:hypothetical protein
VSCTILGTSLLVFFAEDAPFRGRMKPLATFSLVVGILVAAWTAYAVAITWQSNRRLTNAVFGDFGFASVMLIVVCVLALTIWSLVDIAQL